MRIIESKKIRQTVEEMLLEACIKIPNEVLDSLFEAIKNEKSELGQDILKKIIENDICAQKENKPICQDTGIVVCYLEVGTDIYIKGNVYEAINEGVRNATYKGYLRRSVCDDPIIRNNTNDNTPAVVYIKLIKGDKIKITLAPKGAGSENMSALKMLSPTDGEEKVVDFVLETIEKAGGKACPPIFVGVGIGGTFEKSAMLAKEALLDIDVNQTETEKHLSSRLLKEINQLGIGPMGFGGTVTALKVNVKTYPCHIASMPVSVNIECHASRHIKRFI